MHQKELRYANQNLSRHKLANNGGFLVSESIDVHTHLVPAEFPAYLGKCANLPWPSMKHDGCGCAQIIIQGKNYRTVNDTHWDGAKRIADMDRMCVRRQVVSPMPELLSYWLPPKDAAVLLRHINGEIAGLCSAQPERFSGLGGVPLQDVDLAIRELEFLLREQKLAGVEIATNVNGVSIGNPRFEPFFAAAEELSLPIFVHGLHPAGTDRLVGPAFLEQLVGFPGDLAYGIASLITGGMIERHPRLRIAFAHGGGAFAMVLPRLEHGWNTFPALKALLPQAPSAYARKFYYDTLVYNPQVLELIIKSFGAEQIMLGTDHPFGMTDPDPHAAIRTLGLGPDAEKLLCGGNARRFLGMPA